MKRYLFLLAFTLLYATAAAQGLALYFELIPESQLPHLKPDMRNGMVGMYELGQRPASVPNLLNGVCTLDTLSDDYLFMHTSNVSTLEIKMLPMESDSTSILAVIHTVKVAGTEDSSLNLFTKTWSKLNTEKYFPMPSHKDFYVENADLSLEEFSKFCIPLLIKYSIDGRNIVAEIDPEKYLPIETFKKIEPALRKSCVRSFPR